MTATERVAPYRANPDTAVAGAECYHVFSDCTSGSKIRAEERLQGTGGLDICHECEAMEPAKPSSADPGGAEGDGHEEHHASPSFRKKDEPRESLSDKERALIGLYTQSSDRSMSFSTGPPPEAHPAAAEVPRSTHYWYEETARPVTGKSEADSGTTGAPTGGQVTYSTDRYEASHGKKPNDSQAATWTFEHGDETETIDGPYPQALAEAIRHAKAKLHPHVALLP